jgi:hypothetical protein
MPHPRTCSKCSYEHMMIHKTWPPHDMFPAKYKASLVRHNPTDDEPAPLAPYWIRTSYMDIDGVRKPVSDFVACDACITAEARALMTYYPDGWQELSKDEMVSQNIEKQCTVQ